MTVTNSITVSGTSIDLSALAFVEWSETDLIAIAGTAGDNDLRGSSVNDVISGGDGADTMQGLGGDDLYYVDNAGDVVEEADGAGDDTFATAINWQLAAGLSIETLRALDAAGTDPLVLTGNEIANTIIGNAGNNEIDGLVGADTLRGLGGNDLYYVDNAADVVEEADGGGDDTVRAIASYALAAGVSVETLSTSNDLGTAATDLTGNEIANLIRGNAGNNVLDGGGDADTMRGLGGNDTYVVDNAHDVVVEASGGGDDTVRAIASYALADGASIEFLSTNNDAGTAAISLTGNEIANTLRGNAADNVINGGGGADILRGLGGNDNYIVDNVGDMVEEADGFGGDTVLCDGELCAGSRRQRGGAEDA